VPRDLWRQVSEHLHRDAQPGRRATRRLISSRYVGIGLSTDVTAWAKPAWTASGPRSTARSRYRRCTSQYPPAVSATSAWTLLVLCLHLRVLPTCSLSWIGLPAGQSRDLSPPLQQCTAQMLCFMDG
jgi:hypothetical protein